MSYGFDAVTSLLLFVTSPPMINFARLFGEMFSVLEELSFRLSSSYLFSHAFLNFTGTLEEQTEDERTARLESLASDDEVNVGVPPMDLIIFCHEINLKIQNHDCRWSNRLKNLPGML